MSNGKIISIGLDPRMEDRALCRSDGRSWKHIRAQCGLIYAEGTLSAMEIGSG